MKTVDDVKEALSLDTMARIVAKGQRERVAARRKREARRRAEAEYLTRTGRVLKLL